jgi:Uma2 family endonuclease
MMLADVHHSLPVAPPPEEPRVLLHGVTWETYEGLLRDLGDDHPSLRLTYREGTLEIMTTAPIHERIKKVIARLLEAWAEENDVRFDGYGGATFRRKEAQRGLEPDECYVLRSVKDGEPPDIAIEVVHTHGYVDKLDVYAGLGIREVWSWEKGKLTVHVLEGKRYVEASASRLLPSLDVPQLVGFIEQLVAGGDQTATVRAYRRALRGQS